VRRSPTSCPIPSPILRPRCARGGSTSPTPPYGPTSAQARLGIAVTRGLLLDLLATRDRAAVDAAVERWIALNLAAA
jgi:hypothetical protein